MEIGDLSKVWEIKALKKKPEEEKARKILEKIAKQVQPIMSKRKWKVKMLREFWYFFSINIQPLWSPPFSPFVFSIETRFVLKSF